LSELNRRGFAALAAIALAEMGIRQAGATAPCTTGNCSGNQVCCEGYTCTSTGNGSSKYCKRNEQHECPECPDCEECEVCPTPTPGPWLCVVDGDCGEPLTCFEGQCCAVQTVVVENNQTVTVTVPIQIVDTCTLTGGTGRKRRRRRKHHKH
jgi:hypothetical protein